MKLCIKAYVNIQPLPPLRHSSPRVMTGNRACIAENHFQSHAQPPHGHRNGTNSRCYKPNYAKEPTLREALLSERWAPHIKTRKLVTIHCTHMDSMTLGRMLLATIQAWSESGNSYNGIVQLLLASNPLPTHENDTAMASGGRASKLYWDALSQEDYARSHYLRSRK